MLKLTVRNADYNYLSGLLDVMHNHLQSSVKYGRHRLSSVIEVVLDGNDEEQFAREIQDFCAHAGWQMEAH
jgi:hypothetical protein